MINKYRGALLGLATGDALGTTLEFARPGSFNKITDMIGGGPFNQNPGEWTDDTSMALCLAESLIDKNGFDIEDQIQRYVKWWKEGYLSTKGFCFDIGGTVQKALSDYLITKNPYSGRIDKYSAGNGSIMRLAPVPLFYRKDPAEGIHLSAESSRTTHATQVCIDACRYLGALIIGSLNGETKEMLLSSRYSPLSDKWESSPLTKEIDMIACGSFKEKEPPQIKGSGYVVKSLEAALWAFYKTNSFEEGCLLAVNLGDDADTTGAVYGQLAGAYYGENNIPPQWLHKIKMRKFITEFAEKLYDKSEYLISKQN